MNTLNEIIKATETKAKIEELVNELNSVMFADEKKEGLEFVEKLDGAIEDAISPELFSIIGTIEPELEKKVELVDMFYANIGLTEDAQIVFGYHEDREEYEVSVLNTDNGFTLLEKSDTSKLKIARKISEIYIAFR